MLDFNNILATPGADIQYFQGQPLAESGTIASVTVAAGGILTVTSGTYYVGQPIRITGTFSAGSITGYVSGSIYYVITVTSATNITISTAYGGAAVSSTAGVATPGATFTVTRPTWQTWKKPRGARWILMLGVGGGAGGGAGINTGATSGGGASGSSGGQSTLMIPAMFVPDILYIRPGAGGTGATASSELGLTGQPTFVCISPYTYVAPAGTVLFAQGGTASGGSATTTTGGSQPAAVAAATIAQMCLAGRGVYTLLAGQQGISGGAAGVLGQSQTPPTTGLMVTSGAPGGGTNIAGTGGNITAVGGLPLGTDFFPLPIVGGTQAGTGSSVPSGAGPSGFASQNFLFNFGGAGGGGATDTAGGTAGAGGNGAPGCGGGGGGGMNTTNSTFAKGGDGGGGFVYIITT